MIAFFIPRFQFTHPGRGATICKSRLSDIVEVSIHAPREGCDYAALQCYRACVVSIHAPREGCDYRSYSPCLRLSGFNSRTPGGVRRFDTLKYSFRCMFQFTHPGRGATPVELLSTEGVQVSIHAPREGCDSSAFELSKTKLQFQFTHPGRGATSGSVFSTDSVTVSIHAPREGCDLHKVGKYVLRDEFQFTHPGRGATAFKGGAVLFYWFQFTHPGRGATELVRSSLCVSICFNSRTPGGVRPHFFGLCRGLQMCFNSRTPGGVRQSPPFAQVTRWLFQFTHPGRGATSPFIEQVKHSQVSIHAPREGCDYQGP